MVTLETMREIDGVQHKLAWVPVKASGPEADMPTSEKPAAKPARKTQGRAGKIAAKLARRLGKHLRRRTTMKTIAALACGVAAWWVLGAFLPISGATAMTFPALGSFGAFSYKGVLGICAALWVRKRVGA